MSDEAPIEDTDEGLLDEVEVEGEEEKKPAPKKRTSKKSKPKKAVDPTDEDDVKSIEIDDFVEGDEESDEPYANLYLKHRPATFRDIVDQPQVIESLMNAIRRKRVPHAYMFSGTRGTGKTTTARVLAAALNCEMRSGDDVEPCGECSQCKAIISGDAAGVVNEINCASARGLDSMREHLSTVDLSALSNYSVYILDEVHMLTTEASNMLLKTLEEPGNSQVIFILATTDPQKVLETIRSRTVQMRFRELEDAKLRELAESISKSEGLDLTEQQLTDAVIQGRGSARDMISALEYLQNGEIPDSRKYMLKMVEGLVDNNLAQTLIEIAISCRERTFDARDYMNFIMEFWRDTLIYQENPDLVAISSDIEPSTVRAAKEMPARKIVRNVELSAEAIANARGYRYDRLILESAVSKMLVPSAKENMNAVLDGLDDLGDRISKIERLLETLPADGTRTKSTEREAETASIATESEEAPEEVEENTGKGIIDNSVPYEAPSEVYGKSNGHKEADANDFEELLEEVTDQWLDMVSGIKKRGKVILRSAELSLGDAGILIIETDREVADPAQNAVRDIEVLQKFSDIQFSVIEG